MNVAFPLQAGKRLVDLTVLTKSSFLAHLGMRDVGTFLDALDEVAVASGTTIFREGEDGDQMYFVLEGDVRLRRGSLDFARLGRGDHFGETAILGVRRRAATAYAESTARLARLSRARFLSLATNHPRVALHVAEAIAAALALTVSSMTDDVGLLLRQRTLPRRSAVRVFAPAGVIDAPMGALVSTLLPPVPGGALVVAATLDQRPVSLETAVTSDARLEPITIASWEGRRIYRSSVGLLLLEAARRVLGSAVVTLGPRRGEEHAVNLPPGIATAENLAAIEATMRDLAAAATPMREELWAVDEARARLADQGWTEAAALLPFHREKTVSLVSCGGTFALGLGPVLPNARLLSGFSLSRSGDEVLLAFGPVLGTYTSTRSANRAESGHGHAHEMTRELEGWLRTLGVTSVGHFDRSCVNGQVGELIRVSEGFHEKHIGRIADRIAARRGLRVVAIAGPSSSGKTTFIKRLKVQLEVDGIVPVHVSLDDYYVERIQTPKDETGDYDFESPAAIDAALFHEDARRLLAGEQVHTARYDFHSGKSLPRSGPALALGSNNVLLIEGLHALSPAIIGGLADDDAMFRVFVHPSSTLPFDRLTVVLPEDVRLIRRIVRDRHQRGYDASESIRRWPSVRRGEERHVFPSAAHADAVFDSSLVYELAALRVYAERYLLEVTEEDRAYATAYRLRQLVDRFVPIHPDHVPPTSILREFIGGSGFDA